MNEAEFRLLSFDGKITGFGLLLGRSYPFLGELYSRAEKRKKEMHIPAATDGYCLYLDEGLLDGLPREGFNFVLLHGLFHIMLGHSFPEDVLPYEKACWNIAFDLIVNRMLMDMEWGFSVKGLPSVPVIGSALCFDDLSQDSPEDIAREFLRQAGQQGVGGNQASGVKITWKSFEREIPDWEDWVFDILDKSDGIIPPKAANIKGLLASCLERTGNTGLPGYLRKRIADISRL